MRRPEEVARHAVWSDEGSTGLANAVHLGKAVVERQHLSSPLGRLYVYTIHLFRLSPKAALNPLSAELFRQLYDEFGTLEKRLAYYNEKIAAMGAAHPVCQRLGTIPGIGPLTATALVAAVSDASHFKNGRQFAAWIGLVPRQHSTGGKARLLGISKRGDVYTYCLSRRNFRGGMHLRVR